MAQVRRYKKGTRTKLSNNFWSTEFDCQCNNATCQWTLIDLDHVKNLQKLRDQLGESLKITSGYRCPTHNKAVGGATRSRHVAGDATDLQAVSSPPDKVADSAEDLKFDGLGRYNTFTHVDSRGSKARWDFRRKK